MKIDYSDVISWQIFRDKVFVVNEMSYTHCQILINGFG